MEDEAVQNAENEAELEDTEDFTEAAAFHIKHAKLIGILALLAGILYSMLAFSGASNQIFDDSIITLCGNFALSFMILAVGIKLLVQGSNGAIELSGKANGRVNTKAWLPILIASAVGIAVGAMLHPYIHPAAPIPTNLTTQWQLAQEAEADGNWQLARDAYSMIDNASTDEKPKELYQIKLRLAAAEMHIGDYASAVIHYEQALQLCETHKFKDEDGKAQAGLEAARKRFKETRPDKLTP